GQGCPGACLLSEALPCGGMRGLPRICGHHGRDRADFKLCPDRSQVKGFRDHHSAGVLELRARPLDKDTSFGMSTTPPEKPARFKFHPLEAYQRSTGYRLLPFRFLRFDGSRYVLVNEVGEFVFLDEGTLRKLTKHELDPHNPAYLDLKAKHF